MLNPNDTEKAVRALQAGFNSLNATLAAVNSHVTRFVQLANPAAVLRFNLALADMNAVIGRSLTPTLNQFTAVVRGIGNAFAGLDGGGQKLIASIAAGTVGLVAFGAAALVVQTVMTGGLLPVFSAVAGALGGMAFVSGDFGSAIKEVGSIFVGVMNQVGGVLAKFAGSDAFAAIATTLAEVLGTVVSLGGTLLDGFIPVLNTAAAVIQSLAPLVQPILSLVVAFSPLGVAMSAFGSAVDSIAPYLVAGAKLMTEFGRTVYTVMRDLLSYIGIMLPEFGAGGAPRGATRDSTGAAVRSTSTQDVSSVLQKARESAYMMGVGAKDDPAKRTANGMDTLNATATKIEGEIKRFIKELPAEIGKAVAAAWEAVKQNAPQAAINAAASAAATPGGRAATYAISPGLGAAMDAARFLREKFGN